MIKVLLVDHQPSVRQGLRMQLGLEPDLSVVGEAGTAMEALALAQALHPDVAIMDVEMEGMNGIAATEQLCLLEPGCAVIVLTNHDDSATRARAMAAGARAFVAKGSPGAMLAALRRLIEQR